MLTTINPDWRQKRLRVSSLRNETTSNRKADSLHLYLDVISLRTAEEVGGFGRAATRRRGVAVAATLSSTGQFQQWRAADCGKLVEHLRSALLVVGYDCINFDYELIRGHASFRRPKTLDLLQIIQEILGHRTSLENVARATLGRAGLAGGKALDKAWREGDSERVARALRRNLNVMRRLHEHVGAHGWIAVVQDGKTKRCKLG